MIFRRHRLQAPGRRGIAILERLNISGNRSPDSGQPRAPDAAVPHNDYCDGNKQPGNKD